MDVSKIAQQLENVHSVPGENLVPSDSSLIPNREGLRALVEAAAGSDGLRLNDLDAVTIPVGGATEWIIATAFGEEKYSEIEIAVLTNWSSRALWAEDGSSASEGPLCRSDDGLTGQGVPGGQCAVCPSNQWGSDANGSGKACKERMNVLAFAGQQLPLLFRLPATSIAPMRKYFLRLASAGIPSYGITTILGLEQVMGRGANRYSRVKPTVGRRLTDEQVEHCLQCHDLLQAMLFNRRESSDSGHSETQD